MLVFVEGGKSKNNPWSKDENQQQTQPACGIASGIQAQATLVRGKYSHHFTIPLNMCNFSFQ